MSRQPWAIGASWSLLELAGTEQLKMLAYTPYSMRFEVQGCTWKCQEEKQMLYSASMPKYVMHDK